MAKCFTLRAHALAVPGVSVPYQSDRSPAESTPRAGARYRCLVCRLELMLDQKSGKLDMVPVDTADENQATARKKADGSA
jgi:hypothetical protein